MKKYGVAVYTVVLLAIALLLNYIEYLLPIQSLIQIPGIKIGLSNVVILFAAMYANFAAAFVILILKCVVSAALYGSVTSLAFALTGGIIALMSAYMLIKARIYPRYMSIIGVSAVGACLHNVGQLIAGCIMFFTYTVFNYLPMLLLGGLISGSVTGLILELIRKQADKADIASRIKGD